MMNKNFANPYIIYYPVISHDGMPFPVNHTVRDIQEEVNKGRRRSSSGVGTSLQPRSPTTASHR